MSTSNLQPELLPPRHSRNRGLAAAAVAAALGGAVGAAAVGLTAWHIASPTAGTAAIAGVETPNVELPAIAVAPAPAPTPEPEPEPAGTFAGRAAHVVHGSAPMVSLAADAPGEWQAGTPTLVDSSDYSQTLMRDVTTAVPPEHRDRVGTKAYAIDDAGKTCGVTVGNLAVLGKFYGYEGAPETDAELTTAWDYAAPTLVAHLQIPDACGDITWVILPELKTSYAPVIPAVDRSSVMHNAIVAGFRELPAWKSIQAEWTADGQTGPWDNYASTFALIGDTDGGFAVASAGITGCETVQGVASAIWRTRDGELGEPIALPQDLFISKVIGASDLNGDGLPEIIFEGARLQTGVLISDNGRYRAVEGPTTLSHICPC